MKIRQFVSVFVAFVLLFSVTTPELALAAPGGNVTYDTLATDKTSYVEGDSVYVTATSNKREAWVGIYHADDTPGSVDSIYWYYVTQGDYSSGETVDIKTANYNSSRSEYEDLPAGAYKVYFFKNANSYDDSLTVSITILEDAETEVPSAPASVEYTRTTDKEGFADGTVTVTLDTSSGGKAYDLVPYFVDELGNLLEGYSHLQMQPVPDGATTVTFELVSNTLIPKGAKRLAVYTKNSVGLSETYESAPLPTGAANYDFGEPLYEFQIVTDTHVSTSLSDLQAEHFTAMLQDVAANSPDSLGLVISGDVTDTGVAEEYENVLSLYAAVEGAPQMYWTIGNHDYALTSGDSQTQIDLFLEYSGAENIYYDKWIGDTHFIFLGSEETDTTSGVGAIISDTQLDWLETALAERYKVGRPIFVFLHQAVYNTVAGSLAGQGWDGIGTAGVLDDSEARLMSILASYPEVIYFSGHSHWELNSVGTMYERTDSMCTAFNAASVGYLWTSYGDTYTSGNYYNDEHGGSQGYYVEVYEDKILVLGRDFEESKWMPSAMFCVDLSEYVKNCLSEGLVTGDKVAAAEVDTTVASIVDTYLSEYPNSSISVLDANGQTVSSDTKLATGMKLVIDDDSYVIVVSGDVNGDGTVSAVDAQYVLSYIRSGSGLSGNYLDAAAEVLGTGAINIVTVSAILNKVLA